MTDIGLALMWIAISAASAKGLGALARAASMSNSEAELAMTTSEATSAYEHDGGLRRDVSPELGCSTV